MSDKSSFVNLHVHTEFSLLDGAITIKKLINKAAGLNMPGVGCMSLSVTQNPDLVCAGNAFLGELVVTEAPTKSVSTISGLTGLGPVDVAAIYP